MPSSLPSEVVAAKDELNQYCSSQGVPGAVLQSEADILRIGEDIPEGLIPFMAIQQSGWSDVYAVDPTTSPTSIVVWADHAIVARWGTFDQFLQWTKDQQANQTLQ